MFFYDFSCLLGVFNHPLIFLYISFEQVMVFQTIWYQIFENLIKIELCGILQNQIFKAKSFQNLNDEILNHEYIFDSKNSPELNFGQIFKYLVPKCLEEHCLFRKIFNCFWSGLLGTKIRKQANFFKNRENILIFLFLDELSKDKVSKTA